MLANGSSVAEAVLVIGLMLGPAVRKVSQKENSEYQALNFFENLRKRLDLKQA